MIGIELVQDKETKIPAPELRDRLEMMAFERGPAWCSAPADSSIRLCPPLVITGEQADFAMGTLDECLGMLER